MDHSKKVAFPDQILWPRRKIVSGFGLWIAVSLIVLSLLLFSNSLNGRIVSPWFQGFNNVTVTSSFVSWPFSLSTSYIPSNASNNGTGSTKEVRSNVDSLVAKAPEISAFGVVLGKTPLGNFTDKDKNGSLSVKEDGTVQQTTHDSKNGSLSDSGEGDIYLQMTHLGDSPEVVKEGSMADEERIAIGNFSLSVEVDPNAKRSIEGKCGENSCVLNNTVTENNSVGNLSNSGELGRSPVGSEEKADKNRNSISYETCDLFDGRWVRDGSKPYYPASSCPHIDKDFDCHLNGRPDDGFVKWKWKPNGCDIPSLNATDFLERLRGKKLVFVGDSLNRNMWESLVCILRHSIRKKKRVYEISGRTEFKKKGFYAFIFEDYNCTVDFVGSPFLVRESSFKGRNGTFETLRLDLMDRTTSMYHDADVLVFNTGHWWTHEKTSRGEDYYQEGNYVYPRLKVLEAYKKALVTWARWVDKNIDSSQTQVFFRGYSVTHFRGGQWNSGGQCHKETEPIFNSVYLSKYPSKMRVLQHVLAKMKTPVTYLNISRLTDYRKDGHPSIYRMQYNTEEERIAAERAQDCSHWCLPGVPDTWNELLYASLLKAGKGSWKI